MSRIWLLLFSLSVASCSASSETGIDAGSDRDTGTSSECDFCVPGAEVCSGGVCLPAACTPGTCPIGYLCSGNVCQPDSGSGCSVDEECDGGRCVEGACYTFECEPGDTSECETACGRGVETCAGGVFSNCDAPRPTAEFCGDDIDQDCDGEADEGCDECDPATAPEEMCADEFDNDCDGDVDEGCPDCQPEDREACSTLCGDGFRACEDGVFGACSAPTPADEVCDSLDNDCDGDFDEGLDRGCSNSCGDGTEVCSSGTWLDCDAPTVCDCDNGMSDSQDCGLCGTRTRTCAGSAWEDWGACGDEGVCEPGETEYQDCGFGTAGICELGTQQRSCNGVCGWGAWSPCAGAIDPATEVCGDGIDQDCDGSDLVVDDEYETNNTCRTAAGLGFEPDGEVVYGYISSDDDEYDYYWFDVEDGVSLVNAEHILVTLQDVPSRSDYDIHLYRGLENCEANAFIASSALPGDADESIDWEESYGVDEGGSWYVRVSSYVGASCDAAYRLEVTGLLPL